MNTQSNAIPGSHLEAHAIAPTVIPETRRLYWSVRRELWEIPLHLYRAAGRRGAVSVRHS